MSSIKEFQHLKISFNVLKSATDNFSDANCIGRGGFGKVYKGKILLSGVLTVVAIKRLDTSHGQGTIEFWKEIMMLSQYKHEHLVSLLGFCDEGGESLLVYEYLLFKSLDQYLNSPDLSWHSRLRICKGAALGLKFLHEPAEGSQQRVLHRDVKSANILLDNHLIAKISDLGLSKLGPANQQFSFLYSHAVGTPGYCDPLYSQTGLLTKESDVYSFGVVLFEVLCGRAAYVPNYNDIRRSLPGLARKCYEEKKLDTIICSAIRETISPRSLKRFSTIAYQCLNIERAERPSMAEVEEIKIATLYQFIDDKRSLAIVKVVPLKDTEIATENFKTSIGESRYGHMYAGELSIFEKHTTVLVNRFHEHSGLSLNSFLNEICCLSTTLHPNIISMIGYCEEETEMIIVYEYPQRGCLEQYISRKDTTFRPLTWLQRLQICIGTAQGLYHLHQQDITHDDFKSANILLDGKWVAKVAFLHFNDQAYKPPEFISGLKSKEGDVYAFGIVLFEVRCGRLCCEEIDGYNLSGKLIKYFCENKQVDEIVDPSLREKEIGSYSVNTYSATAYRCLLDDPKARPSLDVVIKELDELMRIEMGEQLLMTHVMEKLEIAKKNQEFDSYEHQEFKYEHWERKLPVDIENIIQMMKLPSIGVSKKKVMWLLHKGILYDNNQKFISIKDDGICHEMMSARAFLYPASKMYVWASNSKFRFPEMARFPYREQLKIRCRISTRMLSFGVKYAASLVFWPQSMNTKSSHLLTLNWKCEGLYVVSTHFAEQTEDGWMKVRLWHFVHGGEISEFDIILDKISYLEEHEFPHILIHRIEFEPAEMIGEIERLEDLSISDEDENWKKWIASDCEGVKYMSNTHLEYTSQTPPKKLYLSLCAGILIENGQKLFFLCKSTGGKCHMLPATTVFTNDAHFEDFDRLSLPESRFNKAIQLPAISSCSFECELDPDMFSRGHVYACYLVFKFAEPHVWNHYTRLVTAYCRLDAKETGTFFAHLNSPESVNIPTIIPKNQDGSHDSSTTLITKDPIMRRKFMDECAHSWMETRSDGWMEVMLSKSLHKLEDHKLFSMTLNSHETDFYGIIVQGVEFRPVQRNIFF